MNKIRGLSGNGSNIIFEGLKTLLQITGDFELIKPVAAPYQYKGRY